MIITQCPRGHTGAFIKVGDYWVCGSCDLHLMEFPPRVVQLEAGDNTELKAEILRLHAVITENEQAHETTVTLMELKVNEELEDKIEQLRVRLKQVDPEYIGVVSES